MGTGIGAAIGYLERQGYGSVTLVDEGGNVLIGTTGDGDARSMVAFIVDEYGEGDPKWDDDAYRDCFEDQASGGLRFDRGDVITITSLDDSPDEGFRALLEHRPGIWPGGE